MSILKKLGLLFSAVVFCLSLSVATASAQPGKASWKNNNGKHKGWYKGKHYGWNKGKKTGWLNNTSIWNSRNRRNRNISNSEFWRLQNLRNRINRRQSRYYNDGSLSYKEQQKLSKSYNKYYRTNRKMRRN
jgi:hypothetical protein